ncbi:MAG: TetR family transcriptional regulator [Candidatus Neomarinimicrobiota bacterium]|nr:MAG: TetR family transcriptional regulator [Candidatus Neomarinimicrobiota bacterium]
MVESKKTEKKIIGAAMEVFYEKGRHGAKMQEIADRAGINKAMLHYYFRNKENLYRTIFKTAFSGIFNRLEKAVDFNAGFDIQMKQIIGCYIDMLEKNPKLPLFIIRELGEGGAIARSVVREYFDSGRLQLPHYLQKSVMNAIKSGEIVPIDLRQFMITIIGSSLIFFVAEPIVFSIFPVEEDFDRIKFLEERKKAIFNTLYYGLKPRKVST